MLTKNLDIRSNDFRLTDSGRELIRWGVCNGKVIALRVGLLDASLGEGKTFRQKADEAIEHVLQVSSGDERHIALDFDGEDFEKVNPQTQDWFTF